jgi:hypothetical protein
LRNLDTNSIEAHKQKIYCSGVGMLLYSVKHSGPDIANAVSKALDGTSPAAYKELMHVLKYVMDTKRLSLKMKLEKENKETGWTMVAFRDSDYTLAIQRPGSVLRASFFIYWVFLSVGSLKDRKE